MSVFEMELRKISGLEGDKVGNVGYQNNKEISSLSSTVRVMKSKFIICE
jgi:hypothetical protein